MQPNAPFAKPVKPSDRDKTTGEITSNPNRPDDPEYIVRLVKQIITVSLDTSRIVAGLPGWEVVQA